MANGRNYRGNVPKRRIEKVWSRVVETVTDSIQTVDLHTCEDSKTLVRMIVQGCDTLISGAPIHDLNISVAPAGTTIAGCSVTEALDNDDSKHTLMRRIHQFPSGQLNSEVFHFDSKAMRKLQPGDKIILQTKADVASSVKELLYVTLFFKE